MPLDGFLLLCYNNKDNRVFCLKRSKENEREFLVMAQPF